MQVEREKSIRFYGGLFWLESRSTTHQVSMLIITTSMRLRKTEGAIKNGQSIDTGNIGHTRHRTKIKKKKHTHTTKNKSKWAIPTKMVLNTGAHEQVFIKNKNHEQNYLERKLIYCHSAGFLSL